MNHIDYPIVAKSHPKMYLMHKYWARKPSNVVREYIINYSKKGDIILDPFCGSGPTPLESIKIGRKGIGIDLDPIAIYITKMTGKPIDIELIEKSFNRIKKKCKNKINKFYKTKCKKCGNDCAILATIWERDAKKPIELRYYCEKCESKDSKKPDKNDFKLLQKIKAVSIQSWYPNAKLSYNGKPFMKQEKVCSIPELFTKRNLISLSILFEEIEKIQDTTTRDMFKFAFTSMIHLASRMCPVAKPGGKGHWSKYSSTSFWAVQSYWVPPTNMESNVWMLFDSAIHGKQGLINGKKDSNKEIKDFKQAKEFEDFNDEKNILLKKYSTLELTDIIPEETIDYVFTDPPYGGAVQYFELSFLWLSWLKGSNNDSEYDLRFKDEITINISQQKDFDYYHKMLKASFEQIYLVLKSGKWMTVTFHSTDIRIWNSIIKAVVLAGFNLEKIVYQPPPRTSAKGLLQPYGSAVGDYYIRFRKPMKKRLTTSFSMDERRYERIVVESAKRIIAERGEPTMYQHILNGIVIELQKENALLMGEKRIDDVMKDHLDREFVLIPVKKDDKTVGNKWWFKEPNLIPYLERVSLWDRVETAIVEILNNRIKVTFDEILQSIFIKFPNALTPETQEIKSILDEYAEKASGGKWRLKTSVKVRISEHGKMTYYLMNIGKKLGYNVWVAPGIGSVYNGKSLYEENEKNIQFRFIPSDHLEQVKQIDVLWYKNGKIEYEFEIENTTSITEGITRGSYISYKLKRYIVIPDEREKLLYKKFEQPLIKENIIDNNWNFIRYNDLEKFYKRVGKKNKIDMNNFENIGRFPKLNNLKQSKIIDYN